METYWTSFDTKTAPCIATDVLVIGSGAAGLQAAWSAAEAGRRVLVVVRDELADSNTAKAQGGIAAALGHDDDPRLHFHDTLVAGAGLTDETMAEIVVTEGPGAVLDLLHHGARFDRNPDGTLALGREGCHSRNRIVHANGDSTGAEVSRALREITGKESRIKSLEHCYVTDLLVKQGTCYGVMALHEGNMVHLKAHDVVIATGGVGRLFAHTTNPEGATGSGIALAYRAGVELMDMEFVQFHPTALALPGHPSFLVSEAVRGAGALLYNIRGERFMPGYHPMKELAPRDVVARAIATEMKHCDSDHVLLDATVIDRVEQKFPMIYKTLKEYGLDMKSERIPIAPAAHYMMGGIHTDAWGRTNIQHLYACGEAACTGLQGANRLASNSLLEGLVFGRRTAQAICNERQPEAGEGLEWRSALAACTTTPEQWARDRKAAQERMSWQLGIARDQEDIQEARNLFAARMASYEKETAATYELLDLKSQLLVSWLIAGAALERQESRGAHYRLDYPKPRECWRHHSVEEREGGVAHA
ncbi:MAG: L-aspartate oxidase [Acidaminococcus sp.]|uniref:L-aspartate oxidase n=1 Tax=Acidaminococcus sp. TaxID=1872103 RepID=UPI0026E00224|nr:L-aspartate oxidase [Acidaminococcus sp.]MDO5596818.1 L-aspartate oxidase [Acidaminococcus sp.]